MLDGTYLKQIIGDNFQSEKKKKQT